MWGPPTSPRLTLTKGTPCPSHQRRLPPLPRAPDDHDCGFCLCSRACSRRVVSAGPTIVIRHRPRPLGQEPQARPRFVFSVLRSFLWPRKDRSQPRRKSPPNGTSRFVRPFPGGCRVDVGLLPGGHESRRGEGRVCASHLPWVDWEDWVAGSYGRPGFNSGRDGRVTSNSGRPPRFLLSNNSAQIPTSDFASSRPCCGVGPGGHRRVALTCALLTTAGTGHLSVASWLFVHFL